MSILIVDDSKESSFFVELTLKNGGYDDFIILKSAREAFDYLSLSERSGIQEDIDLILLDIVMSDTESINTLKKIKSMRSLKYVPLIVVTANTSDKYLEKAFSSGATDYVTKPYSKTELLVRVRSALSLKYEMDHRIKLMDELKELNQKLEQMTLIDELTGISNRRHFELTIKNEWGRAKRESKPLSFVLVDIDCFKNYNDHYGHLEGDLCLKEVAQAVMKVAKRPADLVARYGGEEFAVVLPDTETEPAFELANRARKIVENLRIRHDKSNASKYVTISSGVATLIPKADLTHNFLIKAADSALYSAKGEGKNTVKKAEISLDSAYIMDRE